MIFAARQAETEMTSLPRVVNFPIQVAAGVPIACVIGGGYDRDAEALARRHALLHRAASHVWQRRRLGH